MIIAAIAFMKPHGDVCSSAGLMIVAAKLSIKGQ